MHIVLVEDDEVIRETTQISLERFGYTVTSFADGREGFEFVTAHGADAVLLDLMLPTMNGASITRAIRERSTIPIVIVSARSEPIDIVQALEAGADDYLTKPFDMQVLNARIRAVVRRFITSGTGAMGYSPASAATSSAHETVIGPGGRIISGGDLPDVLGPTPGFDSPRSPAGAPATGGDQSQEHSHPAIVGSSPHPAIVGSVPAGGAGDPAPASAMGSAATADGHDPAATLERRLTLGSLTIDTGRLTVEIDGAEVHLTPTELRILLLLTEEPGHVYSREKIAYTVWGYEWAGDSRVVDVHIQRLRKKIGAERIETVRGFGYRFAG
ncbi:MAG TPA: response regulator transcription factor [Brevibacterium senegalense]|uniref:Response regulator transcription factor n=1 Tax=Brevibacterium senegalense TaxID=1033736 RepID=A0A921MDG5_9MICO|nr:response regulator transcription factor [Brevibacterium senegalense]